MLPMSDGVYLEQVVEANEQTEPRTPEGRECVSERERRFRVYEEAPGFRPGPVREKRFRVYEEA
jgi:hypothetical protein